MTLIPVALAYLACKTNAHRLHADIARQQGDACEEEFRFRHKVDTTSNSHIWRDKVQPLAALLLGVSSAAGWQASAFGFDRRNPNDCPAQSLLHGYRAHPRMRLETPSKASSRGRQRQRWSEWDDEEDEEEEEDYRPRRERRPSGRSAKETKGRALKRDRSRWVDDDEDEEESLEPMFGAAGPDSGSVFYLDKHEAERLQRRMERPQLRVGAEAQTLPQPDEKIVADKKMQQVKFVKSSDSARDLPSDANLPEVAVIGRSNVGKSSLLNMLTLGATKAIVRSRPGTTREINHYLVNSKWFLVDLPGYGFAMATDEEREKWDKFTKEYFTTRTNLAGVLFLIDASIPPVKTDADYCDWLVQNNIPFTVVFTKCDRQKEGMPTVAENQESLKEDMMERWSRLPSMIPTSSVTQEGRMDALRYISACILFCRARIKEAKEQRRASVEKAKVMARGPRAKIRVLGD